MNTIKTLGLAAILAGTLGVTEASAHHGRHGHRYPQRPQIPIMIGDPFLRVDPYAPPYCIPGPRYPYNYPYQYPYPNYPGTRIEIPLGRDVRLYINLNDVHPGPNQYYGQYYPYPYRY